MDELHAPAGTGVLAATTSGRPAGIKERLLAAIAAAGLDEITTMLDRLWSSGEFRVQRAPRAGVVMYTVRDPFDTPFHLGEVLVSEAVVDFDGHSGYGAICGDEPERALMLAAVEAAERSGRAEVLGRIGEFIGRLEVKRTEERVLSSKLAAATGVRFEAMKKETVDFGSLGG
jgi:alpha-D-ribose 1-methylphosphonate 5-triphosphate synthase subunit PhnG